MRGALVLLLCAACGSTPHEPQRAPASSAPEAVPITTPAAVSDAQVSSAPVANSTRAPRGVDSDHDHIADDNDRCPAVPEDWDAFGDTDGCPDEDDDGDGIADAKDHCPDAKGSPSDKAPEGILKRPGCPPQTCKTLMLDALRDCFLSSLSQAGMKDHDKVLQQFVQEVSAYAEIEEVTLRAFRVPTEPKEAALARAEPIRARLIALGWPARVSLRVEVRTSGADPESPNLINADITKQRFDYDRQFRPGICTLAGDVYRPERPETACRYRHLD